MATKKIKGTAENWESGKLGENPDTVRKVKVDTSDIDDAIGLQSISIRLDKSLIEDFKAFSRIYGVGYQPLMKQVLARFAESEKKLLLQKHLEAQAAKDDDCKDEDDLKGGDDQQVA